MKTKTNTNTKKLNIKVIARISKAFGYVCLGAYIAVAVEYGVDLTIGAGIALSAILAGVSAYFEKFKRIN